MCNSTQPVQHHRIFDTHSHVLWGTDDGSRSREMSLSMLQALAAQGVTDVVCSSHSWGTLSGYTHRVETLQRDAEQAGLSLRLHTGCEIACCDAYVPDILQRLQTGALRGYDQSDYILLEFLPKITGAELLSCVSRIRRLSGRRIVIAHPERYTGLYVDDHSYETISRLQQMGCLLQLNAYSLAQESDPSILQAARRLLEEQRISFLGSDCHNTGARAPQIAEGAAYVHDHCTKAYAEDVCWRNAARLLCSSST